jgi:hypothetical protein
VSLTEIDPALAQDGRETDAPLTNTRHSSIPGHRRGFLSRIRARFITSRMWIRRVPRRQIAMAAVVSGVAAGALLMFGMTQMNSSPTTPEAAPVVPAAAVPAETPRPAPTPTVFIDELAAAPSPDASAEAGAASPAPSSSVPSGKVGAPGRTPSRGTPAARTPAKKVAKGRDYGI